MLLASSGGNRSSRRPNTALMLSRRQRARVAGAVGHAIGFRARRSLVRENGLDNAEAVDLMTAMVVAAGAN